MKTAATLLLFTLCFGFFACKKTYSCTCTTTVTFPGKAPYVTNNTQPLGQKSTKKQADAICKTSEAQLNEQFQQQLANSSSTIASSSSCHVN